MSSTIEYLSQAICSLSKPDKLRVIAYLMNDPEIRQSILESITIKFENQKGEKNHMESHNTNASLGRGLTPTEMGYRIRENYITQLKQNGIQISYTDGIWMKTSDDLWIAIPYATERMPNRWFLGLSEDKLNDRVQGGKVAITLLCCLDSGTLLDFVLPPSKVLEIKNRLSKSNGYFKFNLKKAGSSYYLTVPHLGDVDMSAYKSNIAALRK